MMGKNHKYNVKLFLLRAIKLLGGFSLARLLTRRHLRILCYHGVSSTDEHQFNGLLFMRPETFHERMAYLQRAGFKVFPLEEVLAMLETGSMLSYPVVITFDDGWHYTYSVSIPIARKFGFPVTVYITSYYAVADVSVLNVVMRYLIWKVGHREVKIQLSPSDEEESFALLPGTENELLAKLLNYVESLPTLDDRRAAVMRFADCLGFNGEAVLENKVFRLMRMEEIKRAAAEGVDIQLHTHRHRFPLSEPTALKDEIEQNRSVLEPLVGKRLVHLCYPSGEYSPQAYNKLHQLGIVSAVTCEPGLINKKTDRFALPRFLDGEDIAPIEFEAEMSGVLEFIRRIRTIFRKVLAMMAIE